MQRGSENEHASQEGQVLGVATQRSGRMAQQEQAADGDKTHDKNPEAGPQPLPSQQLAGPSAQRSVLWARNWAIASGRCPATAGSQIRAQMIAAAAAMPATRTR